MEQGGGLRCEDLSRTTVWYRVRRRLVSSAVLIGLLCPSSVAVIIIRGVFDLLYSDLSSFTLA